MKNFDSTGETGYLSETQRSPQIEESWQLPEELQMMLADGCGPMIIEILAIFKLDTATRLQEVNRAVTSGDILAVRKQMHALKGSARQLGANNLATICEQIEEASPIALATDVPRQISELVAARDQVIRAMDAYAGTSF